MSGSPARTATAEDLFERRVPPLYHLADDFAAIAAACHAMAVRFHGGGTLVAFGNGAGSGEIPGGEIASGGVADHVRVARSDDPCVIKEVHVTTYHVLWELAHVFFEHPGLLPPEVVS